MTTESISVLWSVKSVNFVLFRPTFGNFNQSFTPIRLKEHTGIERAFKQERQSTKTETWPRPTFDIKWPRLHLMGLDLGLYLLTKCRPR